MTNTELKQSVGSQVESEERRELTPCGNIVCTGCLACGCPPLGIEPQADAYDAAADAAQIAFHEFTFGPDPEFLTPRRLTDGRPSWKAALRAATAVLESGTAEGR